MANSIRVHEDVLKNFEQMRLRKGHEYSMYRVNDTGDTIVLHETIEGEALTNKQIFERFVEDLPGNECRYVIYDFRYTNNDDGNINKLVFIIWCPEDADMKQKENYVHFKPNLRQKLVGVGQEIYVNHEDDLSYEEFKKSIGVC